MRRQSIIQTLLIPVLLSSSAGRANNDLPIQDLQRLSSRLVFKQEVDPIRVTRLLKPDGDPFAEAADRACSEAVSNLRNSVSKPDSGADDREIISALHTYDDACLRTIPVSEPLLKAGFGYTVGVLLDKDGAVFCGAARIQKGWILTARHCFFSKDDGYPIGNFRDAEFAPIGGTFQRIRLSDQTAPGADPTIVFGDPIPHSSDQIVLRLENDPLPDPNLVIRKPELTEALVLAGYYGAHNPARQPKGESDPDWVTGLRWVGGGACAVYQINPSGCLYHGCQSERGFSGAPLLTQSPTGGKLVLVGVHIAPASDPGNCGATGVPGLGNIGAPVSIPPKLATAEVD